MDYNHLQITLPKSTALLFAGSALYIGFIDNLVRNAHKQEKTQLVHWSVMYNSSIIPMAGLASLSAIFGANAYRLTKEPFWIYGSLVVFSIIPYTFWAIMGINKKLAVFQAEAKPGVQTSKGVSALLSSWLQKHRVRALLALVAVGLFFVAETRS